MTEKAPQERPEDPAEALLETAFKDVYRAESRFRALGADQKEKIRLFMCGFITAEDTGHPGCSYAPDGTPMITEEVMALMGMELIELPDDMDDWLGDRESEDY